MNKWSLMLRGRSCVSVVSRSYQPLLLLKLERDVCERDLDGSGSCFRAWSDAWATREFPRAAVSRCKGPSEGLGPLNATFAPAGRERERERAEMQLEDTIRRNRAAFE